MSARGVSRGSARSFIVPFSCFVCLAGISAGVLIAALSPKSWFSFAVADVLLLLTTVVVLVLNAKLGKDAFSPLALSAVFYLLAFGVGGIYYWVSPGIFADRYSPSDLTNAVLLANAGWLCLVAGYLLNPFRAINLLLPPFPRTPSSISIFWAIGPLLAIGWTARIGIFALDRYFTYAATQEAVSTGSSWFLTAADLLPTLAAAFVGARSFAAQNAQDARFLRRVYWALLAIEIAWYAPTGARTHQIGLGLMAVIVSYYGRGRRIPWRTMSVAAILIAFIAFPLLRAYRADNRTHRTDPQLAFSQAATKTFGRGFAGFIGSGATATFERFADVTSLALISSRDREPLGGSTTKTLRWIPEAFVPRAILKTKDDPGTIGNEFGAKYGLTSAGFGGNSIAISQVGELYLNFGLLGLLIGMLLVGGFYRLLGDYFIDRNHDAAILAVYAVIAWQLLNGQENIMALGIVGNIKLMLILAVMIVLTTAIQRRWGRSGAPARLRETIA